MDLEDRNPPVTDMSCVGGGKNMAVGEASGLRRERNPRDRRFPASVIDLSRVGGGKNMAVGEASAFGASGTHGTGVSPHPLALCRAAKRSGTAQKNQQVLPTSEALQKTCPRRLGTLKSTCLLGNSSI